MHKIIECKICGKKYTSIKGLSSHIRQTHKVTSKEYYDKYLKNSKEGICLECGKQTSFNGLSKGYLEFCSNRCAQTNEKIRNKIKSTNLERHGVEYPAQSNVVKNKIKTTNILKYGVEYPIQSKKIKEKINETNLKKYGCKEYLSSKDYKEKTKQTNLKKYGVEYTSQSEKVKDKIKQTCLKKYGVESYMLTKEFKEKSKVTNLNNFGVEHPIQNNKIKEKVKKTKQEKYKDENYNNRKKAVNTYKQRYNVENPGQIETVKEKVKKTCSERYGVTCGFLTKKCVEKVHSNEANQKRIETKRKNGTFNTSKLEEDFYTQLLEVFGRNDIERQYKEERYSYNCDFYIKSLDLFIELNGTWTHNNHWFDDNNTEDVNQIEEWETGNTRYYNNAIKTWTERDVEKRLTAKENALNYVVLWNKNDIDEWFSLGCPIGQDWKEEYTWKTNKDL